MHTQGRDTVRYSCRCSFLEIYNETITDLLNPSASNLGIREDQRGLVFVEGLSEAPVLNGELQHPPPVGAAASTSSRLTRQQCSINLSNLGVEAADSRNTGTQMPAVCTALLPTRPLSHTRTLPPLPPQWMMSWA